MTAALRLPAIHAVDFVGYSRLMGKDKEGTEQPYRAWLQRAAWSHTFAVQPHRPCGLRAKCRHVHRSRSPYVLCSPQTALGSGPIKFLV